MDKLNPRQRRFVECYDGDEVNSMRLAGYQGAEPYLRQKALEFLQDPLIIEAIKERSRYTANTKKLIADREERQALWTSIMRNEDPHRKEEKNENGIPIPEGNIPIPVRLKATELLGKSEADFVEKVQMDVKHSLTEVIMQSYKIGQADDMDIEAIEAEYWKAKETQQLPVMEFEAPASTIDTLEDLI